MKCQLFVRCKNAGCKIPGQQIRLPYSTPAGQGPNPRPLPKDLLPARVVCRDCGHWYVYSAPDAEWRQILSPPRSVGMVVPASWIVEIKCGQPNCDSLTKWHIRDQIGLDGPQIANLVLRAIPEIVCHRGHPLATGPAAIVGFRRVLHNSSFLLAFTASMGVLCST